MEDYEYPPENYRLSDNIHPQVLNIQTDGEIVNISGCLSINGLIYNTFYQGYDVLQLEKELYPEKNLFFVTLSPNNKLLHFVLFSHGRLMLLNTQNLVNKININLS